MTIPRNRCHAVGTLMGLCILVSIGLHAAQADEPQEKEFGAVRKREMVESAAKVAAVSSSIASEAYASVANAATQDIETLVTEVTACLDHVRSTTVGGMVGDAIGTSSKITRKTIAISQADRVSDLYFKYHDRLAQAVVAVSSDAPEAKVSRQYIDETLATAEKFILIRAAELDALGEGTVAAEWATLVPLLRHDDAAWNKELVSSLPEWMRKMQPLRAAEYVCLCSGRPKAAYQLWVQQVSAGESSKLGCKNYLANLNRWANACFGSKDFLKGIAILKSTIALADVENLTDEAVKARLRLAEVYAMYGHNQLAAHEMKLLMTAYPNHKEHGRGALMRLKYLYTSSLFDKILDEAPAILEDKAAADVRPQIIYIAWVTNRRQNKPDAADELQKRLTRDYPDNPLCADTHFASAMNLLASGDYAGASRLLTMITDRYDQTPIAAKCREILSRIQENQQRVSQTPSTKP